MAREADPSLGHDRTAVTWIAVDDEYAILELGGTAVMAGVVPRWGSGADHLVDVTEDARVRVVACASAACPPSDDATYGAFDFTEPGRPRRSGAMTLARAGDAVFNFSAERLFVARRPRVASGNEATEIAVFDTTREPRLVGTSSVRGNVVSQRRLPLASRRSSGRLGVGGCGHGRTTRDRSRPRRTDLTAARGVVLLRRRLDVVGRLRRRSRSLVRSDPYARRASDDHRSRSKRRDGRGPGPRVLGERPPNSDGERHGRRRTAPLRRLPPADVFATPAGVSVVSFPGEVPVRHRWLDPQGTLVQ